MCARWTPPRGGRWKSITRSPRSLFLTQRAQRTPRLFLTQRAQRTQRLFLTQRAQRTQRWNWFPSAPSSRRGWGVRGRRSNWWKVQFPFLQPLRPFQPLQPFDPADRRCRSAFCASTERATPPMRFARRARRRPRRWSARAGSTDSSSRPVRRAAASPRPCMTPRAARSGRRRDCGPRWPRSASPRRNGSTRPTFQEASNIFPPFDSAGRGRGGRENLGKSRSGRFFRAIRTCKAHNRPPNAPHYGRAQARGEWRTVPLTWGRPHLNPTQPTKENLP